MCVCANLTQCKISFSEKRKSDLCFFAVPIFNFSCINKQKQVNDDKIYFIDSGNLFFFFFFYNILSNGFFFLLSSLVYIRNDIINEVMRAVLKQKKSYFQIIRKNIKIYDGILNNVLNSYTETRNILPRDITR